jgi:hypothetical protein
MDLIKHPTAVDAANPPTPVQTGTPGWAAGGQTVITADTINGIIAELKNVIEGAGLDLNVNNNTLLKTAIDKMIGETGMSYDPLNQGTVTVDALKFVASILQSTNITSTAITSNTLTVNAASTLKGTLNIQPAGNGYIKIGRIDHVASTPLIDFNCGATPVTTDARIIATGGNGVNFGGNLTIQAAQLNVPAGTMQGADKIDSFPTGTMIPFYQSVAPAGWVSAGLGSNFALITGAGGTYSGGNGNIVTGCNMVASHTHTVNPASVTTSSSGQHTHTYKDGFSVDHYNGDLYGGENLPREAASIGSQWEYNGNIHNRQLTSDGVSALHTHTVDIPSTTTSANTSLGTWQPAYVTVLVCRKV